MKQLQSSRKWCNQQWKGLGKALTLPAQVQAERILAQQSQGMHGFLSNADRHGGDVEGFYGGGVGEDENIPGWPLGGEPLGEWFPQSLCSE
jgi:hypothetical protein